MEYLQEVSLWSWRILGTGAVTFLLWHILARPRGVPPGPRGFPLVGNLYQLSANIHKDFVNLGEKYGDIFSIYIGPTLVIVLNSYDVMKEAFVNMGTTFADRPRGNILHPDVIAFFGEHFDDKYVSEKKFATASMRHVGYMTGPTIESKILSSVEDLIDYLVKQNSKPCNLLMPINKACCKIVCQSLFNKDYSLEDPELAEFVIQAERLVSNYNEGAILADCMSPWASKMFFRKVEEQERGLCSSIMDKLLRQIIQDHRQSLDVNNPRDMLDCFLAAQDRSYTDQQLGALFIMFYTDATATTPLLIFWNIFYLTLYPKWQESLHEEIAEVLGTFRPLRVADRSNLPKVEAFLQETSRVSGLVTTTLPHKPLKSTTLRGYHIPKYASIIGNFWATNMDPVTWPEPEMFRPERHLDSDGTILRSEKVNGMLFGLGQRSCLGQQKAKNETFLFVTSLLQKFKFCLPEDEVKLRPQDATSGVIGHPPSFKVQAIPR